MTPLWYVTATQNITVMTLPPKWQQPGKEYIKKHMLSRTGVICNHRNRQGIRRLQFARAVHSHHPFPADPSCSVHGSDGMIPSAAWRYWRLNYPFHSERLTMHCQWGGKLPKLPLPLGILPEEDRATAIRNMHKNLVKIAREVPEIFWRTDRHTHTDVLITILRHRCRGRSNKSRVDVLEKFCQWR